ncbi:DUF6573 family protein [Oerskovia douganii]|uniref:DUF6573 family protein n=1 Tax=Oerskovia douganii TaxID=2762210 RepID=UPI0038991AE3
MRAPQHVASNAHADHAGPPPRPTPPSDHRAAHAARAHAPWAGQEQQGQAKIHARARLPQVLDIRRRHPDHPPPLGPRPPTHPRRSHPLHNPPDQLCNRPGTQPRLRDVLWMAYRSARTNPGRRRVDFRVLRVRNQAGASTALPVTLSLELDAGDTGEPVATVMLPEED